ncbi:DUF3782 domain-containing protein [bacterium]|nr:DUF3782 domain-containing protein [bacterium]
MTLSVEFVRKLETLEPQLKEILLSLISEIEKSREESIGKSEFNELKAIVKELAEAQKRTEARVEELAEAQKRTEKEINRLDQGINRLDKAVAELAEAQKRTEESLNRFERQFTVKVGALGARWGLDSEEAFREAIKYILQDVGFKVERYLGFDKEGTVFGRPDQIELDLVIKNEKTYIVEIKSSADKSAVAAFNKKVDFYEKETSCKITKRIIISPFIDPSGTQEIADAFGIRLVTQPEKL